MAAAMARGCGSLRRGEHCTRVDLVAARRGDDGVVGGGQLLWYERRLRRLRAFILTFPAVRNFARRGRSPARAFYAAKIADRLQPRYFGLQFACFLIY